MSENKQYENEYKVQAVKLAKKIGAVNAANELQIPVNTLYGWWNPADCRTLRKNLCKFKNCDKSDILERLKNNRSNFLQYTTDTVICQGSLDISLPEWSAAEWNQADIRRLSRACRGT